MTNNTRTKHIRNCHFLWPGNGSLIACR